MWKKPIKINIHSCPCLYAHFGWWILLPHACKPRSYLLLQYIKIIPTETFSMNIDVMCMIYLIRQKCKKYENLYEEGSRSYVVILHVLVKSANKILEVVYSPNTSLGVHADEVIKVVHAFWKYSDRAAMIITSDVKNNTEKNIILLNGHWIIVLAWTGGVECLQTHFQTVYN